MSGHSKWSTIKHKKAAKDAKKGKVFTKLIREIMVAARSGGSDPNNNPKLRAVVIKAKQAGMSSDNVVRACKKGAGELEGEHYEEVTYEGFGPGGVALLIESLTDNRQRTVGEVRHVLTRHNGSLGAPGSVSYMFTNKGLFVFSGESHQEEPLLETLLDAGVEDISTNDEGNFEVTCDPHNFEEIREYIEQKGLETLSAELTKIPTSTVRVGGEEAERLLKLMDLLDDLDDVQNVYANFDLSAEEFAALSAD